MRIGINAWDNALQNFVPRATLNPGDTATAYIMISHNGDREGLKNPTVVVDLKDKNIDLSQVTFDKSKVMGEPSKGFSSPTEMVKGFHVDQERQLLTIDLETGNNYELVLPIHFKWASTVPANYIGTLTAEVKDELGYVIKDSVASHKDYPDYGASAIFANDNNPLQIRKKVNGIFKDFYSVDAGKASMSIDGFQIIPSTHIPSMPDPASPVEFTFDYGDPTKTVNGMQVGAWNTGAAGTEAHYDLARAYKQVIVEDTLPLYSTSTKSRELTKVARFVESENPGWKVTETKALPPKLGQDTLEGFVHR